MYRFLRLHSSPLKKNNLKESSKTYIDIFSEETLVFCTIDIK